MACTTHFLSTASLVKNRLLVAFAASLFLHLAAFALLITFIPASNVSSGRLTALPKASLIVTLTNPEKSGRFSAALSAQASQKAGADEAAGQNARKGGSPASLHILQGDRYFLASELDVIPKIQHDIDLYPAELQGFKRGGRVVLGLWIDENGRVERTETISSELPAIFAEVATQRFMQEYFFPGKKHDLAVKSRVEVVLFYPSPDLGK